MQDGRKQTGKGIGRGNANSLLLCLNGYTRIRNSIDGDKNQSFENIYAQTRSVSLPRFTIKKFFGGGEVNQASADGNSGIGS